ncbi:TrmB family transcriptional regulator [Alcaligenaceae bacterium]|nr:TrmB family transcriptional regulator [Alcaligenaceae bacterium]
MITNDSVPSREQLLRELQGIGFSDYEAKAYVALILSPNSTAYEISKAATIPKANCYTVLENLRKKGAVQAVSENPVKYVAVDPQKYFNQVAVSTQLRCEKLQDSLSRIAVLPQEELVWSLNDKNSVQIQIGKIIDSATDHLWIKASDTTLTPHKEALREAVSRGVNVLIVLFGKSIEEFDLGKNSKVYLHEGNGIPVGIAHTLITITRDFQEMLVAEVGVNSYGSYTKNRPIVNMADSLIRHEIYFAEIFKELGEEIDEKFGRALFKLRQKYLPKPQAKALEKLLQTEELKA